ncbi:MAG: 4-(cytidine 5'-diphospho)-2-C-methyl-D-erythritol kinase [Buchananella hordeovulneris]|nr:4-(cytidine 5'-diphospho)-2-C-methyl-D-erythritol kinase [Buchananella hordeovulneris]
MSLAAGKSVQATAPGKVNLYIGCGGVLPDGYHLLDTVFLALNINESATATLTGAQKEGVGGNVGQKTDRSMPAWLEVTMRGQGAENLPIDATNLVVRAAKALAARLGWALPTRIAVEKRVPIAAGMAGGSADAALTLAALNALWMADVPPAALLDLARGLGADVPFGLVGGIAHAGARGDEPLALAVEAGVQFHLAFFSSPLGLPTPAVFHEFDAAGTAAGVPAPVAPPELLAAAVSGDAPALAALISNDLQAPALRLRPELARTIAAAERAGALRAFVSGSGPTVAALCTSAEHAAAVARAVTAELGTAQLGYELVAFTASGPAAGAHVTTHEEK